MVYKEMLKVLGFFHLEKRGLRGDAIATGRMESGLAEALGHKSSSRAVLLVPDRFWGAGTLHRGLTPLSAQQGCPRDGARLCGQDLTVRLRACGHSQRWQFAPHHSFQEKKYPTPQDVGRLSWASVPWLHDRPEKPLLCQPQPRRKQHVPWDQLCTGATRAQQGC